jgi:hypothetical protein
VGGSASLIDQILAFNPAQWIRFTTDHVLIAGGIEEAFDLSPNGRNVAQGTLASKPAFSNPGANFDGSNDYLITAGSAFLHGSASFSLFLTLDLAGETLTALTQTWGRDAGDYCYSSFDSGEHSVSVNTNVGLVTARTGVVLSGASGRFVVDSRVASGNTRCWSNGVAGANNATAFATINANGAYNIGCAALTRHFPGTIQDLLVFTPAPSLADQATVRALLAQLDGVTL